MQSKYTPPPKKKPSKIFSNGEGGGVPALENLKLGGERIFKSNFN